VQQEQLIKKSRDNECLNYESTARRDYSWNSDSFVAGSADMLIFSILHYRGL